MEIYSITTKQEMLEKLSVKIGGFSIYLGIMLFINMYLFFRGRRISKQRALEAKQYPGLANE
jgi:F0F1-type ATP synthase assembly protein I